MRSGRKQLNRFRKIVPAIAAVSALAATRHASATNGSWSFLGNGSWSVASNWAGGVIANGASGIADFSKLNITQDQTVSLDSPRTIGQLLFADTSQSNNWTLDNNGDPNNVLTLNNGASAPVITIGAGTVGQIATISATLAGANGFTKTGPGALQLTGTNTFTGQVTLNSTTSGTGADLYLGSNNALGAATNVLFVDPVGNATGNITRVRLNAGVTISNPITLHTVRAPQQNGELQTNGIVNATLNGPITIDGPVGSGGDFSGPSDGSFANFLTINGPITLSNLYPAANLANANNNGVIIRAGNIILAGGGNYFRIEQRAGEMRLGANNGIATNAYLDLGANNGNPGPTNATLDLFGFNQTMVGLENLVSGGNTITNSANTPSVLTLTPSTAANASNLVFANSTMTDTQGTNPNSLLSVTINGAPTGLQTFNNPNSSYHGATTLISGILAVNTLADGGNNSAIGASPSDASNLVFSGGTLRYTGGNTSTNRNFTASPGTNAIVDVSVATTTLNMAGSGIGGGGFTKLGAGTLVFAANQTYSGNTAISGGALVVNGNTSATSNVSIAGGATLAGTGTLNGTVTPSAGGIIAPAGAGSTGSITVGALTLNTGAQINLEFDSNNDQVTVANSKGLTLNGGNLFLFNTGTISAFASNGTYTLFNINGGFNGLLDNLTISNPVAGKFYNITSTASAINLTIGDATTVTWTGNNNTDSWTDAGNWSGSIPNAVGQTASFGSANGSGSVNMNGNKTVSGLIFNAGNNYTIFGTGDLTIDNGSAAGAITVSNGQHEIDVPIVLNGAVSVMTTNGGDSLTLTRSITGAFPLNVSGPGSVSLTGSNSFTTMSVNSGTLNVGTGGANATLGTGSVTLANNAALNFNTSSNDNFGQSITGAGTVSQLGSGTTTIGALNVTGVNVSNGALITSTIAQSNGVNVTGSGSLTANGAITGAGSLVVNTSGGVLLGASNTYTGGTEVDAGTLTLGAGAALPTNDTLAVNGGTLDLNGRSISVGSINDQSSSTGVITNNGPASSVSVVTFNGNKNNYNMYAALNDGANGGKIALISTIQNVDAGTFSLAMHASSTYSGGTTVTRQSVDAYANNALGTGSVVLQTNNASVNNTHLGIAGGITLPNAITIQTPNGGGQGGAIQYLNSTSGSSTLTGPITFQSDPFTGGDFFGPTNGTDSLNINGPVNTSGTATGVTVIAGHVGFGGGGNYPQLTVYGTFVNGSPGVVVDNAPNGIATGAVLNVVAGFVDFEANNQTLAGLIGPAGSVANSPSNFATLTLHESSDNSYGGTIGGNLNLVKNGPAQQTFSGNSTYTGSTVVQNGSLRYVGSGAWNQVTNGNATTFTDIQGGKVVFDYTTDSDPVGTVSGLLAASYMSANSFNNTTGAIRSSTGSGTLGLGMFDDGVSQVTVAYTVFGDANLDGKVNALDFNALATNFGNSNVYWYQGDFNYDNTVNTSDFMVLAQNFNKLAPAPSAAPVLGALVPEPASLSLVTLAIAATTRRRRQRA
jgi:autotransporter-associated beta strand protein